MKLLQQCCSCMPKRLLLVILSFFGFVVTFQVQVSLAVALNEIAGKSHNSSFCISLLDVVVKENQYDWSSTMQGFILSAAQMGLIVGLTPAGVLVDRYGAKHFITATFTLRCFEAGIIPTVAKYGPGWLVGLRIVSGLTQAFTWPGFSEIIARWVPKREQTASVGFVVSGVDAGMSTGTLFAGLILREINWEWVYYIFGIETICWTMLWALITSPRPENHPFISEREKEFLMKTIPSKRKKLKAPWKLIFTNRPVWVNIIGSFSVGCSTITLFIELPRYMMEILGVSAYQHPILLSLPSITLWISSTFSGCLLNVIIKYEILTVTKSRRFGAAIGAVGALFLYITTPQVACNTQIAMCIMCIGCVLHGFFTPSVRINVVDLTPNYAGSIAAIGATLYCLGGISGVQFVSIMTEVNDLQHWTYAFLSLAAVVSVTIIPFILFASAEIQPFNDVRVPILSE